MTEQIVEIADQFYGWYVFQLFHSRKVAEAEMKRLAEIRTLTDEWTIS